MEGKKLRILVVDDYDAWRSFVASTLERQPHFSVVGLAADGSEAILKIENLQPDLIVLDIGLPKINGLEVALRVGEISPRSKVLMVSETRNADIVQEAVCRGALGYVVKSSAAGELMPAIEAVLQGKPFIGSEVIGNVSVDSATIGSRRISNENVITRERPRDPEYQPRHEVAFYPDDAAYIAGLTRYIETVLKRRDPVVMFATAPHQAGILQRLKSDGVDVDALVARERVILNDPFESLSVIMVDGKPDAARCTQALSALIAAATRNSPGDHSRVAFCGQCAPLLLSQGNADGAIELEQLWDKISLSYGADTLCGYISSGLPSTNRQELVQRICAEHSAVHGLESSL